MLRRGLKRQGGQALILVAIAVLVLTAILALALDGGRIYLDRRQLQNAADAAALAGAEKLQVLPYPSFASAHAQALQTLVKNLPGTSAGGFTAPATASWGWLSIGANYQVNFTATPTTYKAQVRHTIATVIAPIHGFASTMQLTTEATAQNGSLPFAIVLLQQSYSASYANLQLNGSPASLTLSGGGGLGDQGGVYSNASMNLGTGQINFGSTAPNCPYGGVGGTGNSGDLWAVYPTPLNASQVSCPQTPGPARSTAYSLVDPGYPEPAAPATNISNGATVLNGNTTYLCPGQYGNKIAVSGTGSTAVLLPGAFHVQAGGVSVGAGSVLRTVQPGDPNPVPAALTNCNKDWTWSSSDTGVILEITPANAAGMTNCNQHQFSTAGSSTVTLVPSPRYLNISIFVEPFGSNWQSVCSSPPYGTNVVAISGGSNYSIYGSIYGPEDNMSIGGGGGGWGVGQIIAWTLKINSNGNVNETYDPTKVPYIKGLIE